MEEKVYLDKLAKRDIKPTAIRLLILKSMMEAGRAVSQLDLETLLDTVDKSTISRTITLFLSHHLIHSIDDGSGSWKYAVCDDSCNCVLKDLHSHFLLREMPSDILSGKDSYSGYRLTERIHFA